MRESDIAGVAAKLAAAKKVVVVPGYGLAVAKGQYATAEITKLLKAQGAEVRCAVLRSGHLDAVHDGGNGLEEAPCAREHRIDVGD